MKKILIVKTGSTYASLRAIRGDFDQWVVRRLGRDATVQAETVDATSGVAMPVASHYAGVVVTGSHAMLTRHPAWSERLAVWLRTTVEEGVPVLGICYGHQLLAYAFGGEVADNPHGLEYGTVVVTPNALGAQDVLLGEFQGPFKAHTCHRQVVVELPKVAVPLASTRKDIYAAFSVNNLAWGVQFHPEFDRRVMQTYILRAAEALTAQGQDVQDVMSTCVESGCGHTVFQQFLKVVAARVGLAARPALAFAV